MKQTKGERKIARVMARYRDAELRDGRTGELVQSRSKALAIAMSEARRSCKGESALKRRKVPQMSLRGL